MQQHRVDGRDDRGIGADREGQLQHAYDAETRALQEQTGGEASVLEHPVSWSLAPQRAKLVAAGLYI